LEFPILNNNKNHAYLSIWEYLSGVPERFYNETACGDILDFLNNIREKEPGSLVKILNDNEFQSMGFKSLNEINSLKFHDMAIPTNEFDLMRFCNNHIHPNYLKLVEGIYSNFIFPISAYQRIDRGKKLEGFDIYNRVEELKGTSYEYLSNPYNNTIRNAIAHGKVVFKQNDIIYIDTNKKIILSSRDTINLFDDMLDISNGLSLGFCLFYFTNLEFLEEHDIIIPLPIMIEELKAETNATGWKIRGYLESETSDNRSQLIIFAKNGLLDRLKLNYHVLRSAFFAEKFSPGYRRYFISLDSKYSLPGWAAFDGSELCKLRNKHIDNLQDYYKTLESIFFHPKFKLPRFVFKVATFFSIILINLPVTLLEFKEKFYKLSIKPREVTIHQNKFHSVIKGSVIVNSNSNMLIDELIRNNSGSIVRKTIKTARKNAKITDISKYLPVGYLRINIYSKDFRKRKLKNSGLIPELLCTIEFKRLERIRTIDIIGGRPEIIKQFRIVWNEKAKIIEHSG
jgi:hypothetical protein